MKKHRLKEFVIDPSSEEFSMSRACLPVMILIDLFWVIVCVLKIPPAAAFGPVSSMLGIATGAVCGVYGVSSGGGAFGRTFGQAIISYKDRGITPGG